GKSPPDGYTLLVTSEPTFTVNPSLYAKVMYDPVKDFVPISRLVFADKVLAVHPAFAAKTIGELISVAREKPGEINYGTFGIGSAAHLETVLLEREAGIKLTPVHYRGAAPALTDVVAGHIQMLSVDTRAALPLWKDGRVRLLGVGTRAPLAEFPNVPPVAASVPGFEANTWFGLFASGGTPRDIVDKIHADVVQIFEEPEFQREFLAVNMLRPAVMA